jgi:hypothetical protein
VRFKDYKGGAAIQQGEVFDPTPQNIEARVIRATLPNGLKLVMFPKKTRGGTVVAVMNSPLRRREVAVRQIHCRRHGWSDC